MTKKVSGNRKNVRSVVWLLMLFLIAAALYAFYLFNLPHRNVQDTVADYAMQTSDFVSEYLKNYSQSNAKYLSEDGDSKILLLKGPVAEITEDFNGNKVVLLLEKKEPAGVLCTFLPEATAKATKLKAGDIITVKGVVRNGPSFDKDLGMFENANLTECNLVASN